MGRLDSQRAVHIDRESVMSGDESLFLDLTDKVKDLLSPAHRKGRDHNVSSAVQSSLDDLRELLDVLMGPVMGAVAVSALHHHIIRLIRILRVLDQRLILVSDIATLPIQDSELPLLAGIIPILALVCFEVMMSAWTLKSNKVRNIISGNPKIIIKDGVINQQVMSDLRFSIDDLMEQLRINGVFDIREVSFAIVETTGSISVYQKYTNRPVTPAVLNLPDNNNNFPPAVIVDDGTINIQALDLCGLSKQWLYGVLKKEGYALNYIFLMTSDNAGSYLLVPKEKMKK